MRTTRTTSSGSPSGRAPLRLALPLVAVAFALTGCAGSGPAAEPDPSQQETTVQPTPESSAAPSVTPSSTAPSTSALLTVSIKQDAAVEPVQYTLECVDGVPGPTTSLPNADAACATLARLGTEFFTARPNKDIICTQQYGGPQTASITGELNGTTIRASFALTDGCLISRWKQVTDILGAPGGQ